MNITIEVKNALGEIKLRQVSTAYLVKFVDPTKEYPVSYTMDNHGNKKYKPAMIKGEDLTQNQIAELFSRELL